LTKYSLSKIPFGNSCFINHHFFQTRNKKPISEKIGIKRAIERDFNQYMSLRKNYMEERGIKPSRNQKLEREEHLEIA
jgi:superoxide dismutase